MAFVGKVVAITGGGSGIGLATAILLASEGANISLCDVQQKSLDEAKKQIKAVHGEVITAVVDVRRQEEVDQWIRATVDKFGQIDGAVNAAGIGGSGILVESVHEITDSDWELVFDVNVKGVLRALHAEIPAMKEGGSIVNLASLAGVSASVKNATYAASKAAVVSLSRSAAKEQGYRNIRVNSVCPGPIDTPLLKSTSKSNPETPKSYAAVSALQRIGQPSEVADLIVFLLSNRSSYITGTTQVIDGGFL